jgi:7-cyano-7-deazaguanine synthase
MEQRKAVVLLSGGLDSTTVLALAKHEGWACYCLTFAYGQRHAVELEAARTVAARLGAQAHRIVDIDLRVFGGSALTDATAVPKDRKAEEMQAIPVTYVPARNTIFLAYALAWAEVLQARAIFIGVNAVDYSGYPDCRPEFIAAFQQLANYATKAAVEGTATTIHAPLIHMTKAEIIRRGLELRVDYSITHSCYDPKGDLACGRCDSCILRRKGFADAGVPDPTRYVRASAPGSGPRRGQAQ